jgi:hypothetical protein
VALRAVVQRGLVDLARVGEKTVEGGVLLGQVDEDLGVMIERLQVLLGDAADERVLALGLVEKGRREQAAYDQAEQRRDQEALAERKSAACESREKAWNRGLPRGAR